MRAWRLSGIGKRLEVGAVLEQVGVGEHADRLLEEERVAAGVVEEQAEASDVHAGRRQQLVQEDFALVGPKRLDREEMPVVALARVRRVLVRELRPSRAYDGELAGPLEEREEELQQGLLGPVQVLEDQKDRRPCARSSMSRRMPQWSSPWPISSTPYVPSGVVATPRRFAVAAAIVRSSSRLSVARRSRSSPSFRDTLSAPSSCRIPAAPLRISATGQ